jgi:hypothetical protein
MLHMAKLRVLVGARVSHVQGPEKISHVVQQEAGAKWAKDHGHDVVGTVEDLGVSASVSPFARDDLGPWLSPEKAHEWDVLMLLCQRERLVSGDLMLPGSLLGVHSSVDHINKVAFEDASGATGALSRLLACDEFLRG